MLLINITILFPFLSSVQEISGFISGSYIAQLGYMYIKIRRCGIIAKETTFHQRHNDVHHMVLNNTIRKIHIAD